MGCCGVTKTRSVPRVAPVTTVYLSPTPEFPPVSTKSTAVPAVTVEPPKELGLIELPEDSEPQLEQLAGIVLCC